MDNLHINPNDNALFSEPLLNTPNLLQNLSQKPPQQLSFEQIPDFVPIVTSYQYLEQEIIPTTQLILKEFSTSSDFDHQIQLAFGYGCNLELAHTLINHLADNQLIPNIEIIPQSQLQADGAFGNNTIYLSQDLVNPKNSNSSQAVNVLLEEIGHYIDDKINIQDAVGDEGELFAYLVQNQVLAPEKLAALKAENDHSFLELKGEKFAVEHAGTPGIFLVDNTGKISINFLADAGSYRSEMAIFSIQGLDNFTPGSGDYIKEATRRALSNSPLGYIVIIDPNEGAKFTGELGENNQNEGNYSGIKTFDFTPGSQIAMMLVPQGTVQQVFDNPNVGNNQRPLFSIAAANPNNATQMGQLVPGTFGWEDIRVDQNTDADYNDIIFQIKGATGTTTEVGQLFAAGKDWRNLPLGQEIITFASIGLIAKLAQDTGIVDSVTNNSEIVGSLNNASNISKLEAKLGGSNFADILSELKPDGNFVLNKNKLAQINGGQLADGEYQLTLRAENQAGNVDEFLVKFTLDTNKPGIPTDIGLKNDSDTVTNQNKPTITGKGETGALIEILDGQTKLGETIVVNGFWEITTSQITDGLKNLTIRATDIAGNRSDASNKEFTIDSALPQINITNPQANAQLTTGARLQGTVNGTGSTITQLTYRFNNGSEINVPVNAQGAFDVELNLIGLSSGQQNLMIKAVDLAGNSTETTQVVVITQSTPDTTAPSITASLNNDTGINTDGITFDSTIKGTVTDASEITKFQAKLNSGNFVDVLSKLQNGSFTLDKDTLTAINGGNLPDGNYQITLKAEDKFANVSPEVNLGFTLDTTKPAAATELKIKDDTDTVTKDNTPIISGQAETATKVQIFDGQTKLGETTSENGVWEITTSQLTDGVKNLTVITTDIAGNVSDNASLSITVDTVVPDFNITAPQANAQLTTGARLQGTVNGTGSTITQLTYRFNNGSEINVPVNADGSFDVELNLTGLSSGQQNLIIKVVDLAGNITTTNLSVEVLVSNMPSFASDLELSNDGLFVNETADIGFSVTVKNPSGLTELPVFEVDNQGELIALGSLFDDGDIAKGDEIAGDGSYNNKFTFTPTSEGDKSYVAVIPTTQEKTAEAVVEIIVPITDAQFQAILDFNAQTETQFSNLLSSNVPVDQVLGQVKAILEASSDHVKPDSIVTTDRSIAWESQEGILSMLNANLYLDGEERGGVSSTSVPESLPPQTFSTLAATEEEKCNKALVLAPYFWWFDGRGGDESNEGGDESNEIAQKLRDTEFDVIEKRNATETQSNITIEDFKNLQQYNAIVITSHGDNFDGKNFGQGYGTVIDTGQQATVENKQNYQHDLLRNRLALNGSTYVVRASFIEKYTEDMPDSIVYVGACRSTYSLDLAFTFLDEGAKAFLGYSDYVNTSFANTRGQIAFDTLIEGKTTGQIPVINDIEDIKKDKDPARFQLFGSYDATLSHTQIQNGDFEKEDFHCWIPEGDTDNITSLGPLSAPQGDYMGFISDDFYNEEKGTLQSSISQTFLVPDKVDKLQLTYNLLFDTFLPPKGSDDNNLVFDKLIGYNPPIYRTRYRHEILLNGEIFNFEDYNNSTWQPVNGIDLDDDSNSIVYQTGFKTVNIDLTQFRGEKLELKIQAVSHYLGDGVFQSGTPAVLLDSIKVVSK